MLRRPPGSTLTATLVPYTTLCRHPARRSKPRRAAPTGWKQYPRAWCAASATSRIHDIKVSRRDGRRRSRVKNHEKSPGVGRGSLSRSEEHTSELQSLMRISYAVFCLKKNNKITNELANN